MRSNYLSQHQRPHKIIGFFLMGLGWKREKKGDERAYEFQRSY